MALLIVLGVGIAEVFTVLVGYASYKYKTVAGVEAELAKVEADASADVKALVAKIKTHL